MTYLWTKLPGCRAWGPLGRPGQDFAAVGRRTCPGPLSHLATCLDKKFIKFETQVAHVPQFAWVKFGCGRLWLLFAIYSLQFTKIP